MKIYVVRHGQTKWNEQGRMQGAKNSNLTEKGIDEAKKLNEYIKDIDFDKVFVSPLGRTIETMNHVVGDRIIETEKIEDLQEMNFGKFEGELLVELKDSHPEDMEKLWTQPEKYSSTSGEIYADVFERVERALKEITAYENLENVLVVTHGVIISVLLSIVKKNDIARLWDTPVVRNTSLSILEFKDGDFEIVEENIIEHLC